MTGCKLRLVSNVSKCVDNVVPQSMSTFSRSMSTAPKRLTQSFHFKTGAK